MTNLWLNRVAPKLDLIKTLRNNCVDGDYILLCNDETNFWNILHDKHILDSGHCPTQSQRSVSNTVTVTSIQHSHSVITESCLAYYMIITLKIILIKLVTFLLLCDKYCSCYLNFIFHVTVSCVKFCDWRRNTSSHCSVDCQWENFIILCVGKRWHGKCLEQILNWYH